MIRVFGFHARKVRVTFIDSRGEYRDLPCYGELVDAYGDVFYLAPRRTGSYDSDPPFQFIERKDDVLLYDEDCG